MNNKLTVIENSDNDIISNVEDYFSLSKEIILKVPCDYKHSKCLRSFRKRNYGKCILHNSICDKDFSKVSSKLIPCRTYIVQLFEIKKRVLWGQCIIFLRKRNSCLVGAQGLSLLWEQSRNDLPDGKIILSLDEEGTLCKNEIDDSVIPYFYRYPNDEWSFDILERFECGFTENENILLSFK